MLSLLFLEGIISARGQVQEVDGDQRTAGQWEACSPLWGRPFEGPSGRDGRTAGWNTEGT